MSFQIRSINLCMLVASMKTVYHICVVIVDVKVAFLIFFLFTRNAHCCNVFSVTDDVYLCDWLQKNCYEKRLYVEYILLHVQVYETLYAELFTQFIRHAKSERFRRIRNVAYFCRHFTSLAAWSMRYDGAHTWHTSLAIRTGQDGVLYIVWTGRYGGAPETCCTETQGYVEPDHPETTRTMTVVARVAGGSERSLPLLTDVLYGDCF